MKSYGRLGHINFRATTPGILFGMVFFSAALALAAPQYDLHCDDCHTMPPLDSASGEREPATGAFKGNHQGHADSSVASCTRCHGAGVASYATGHRTKAIQVQGNINNSPSGAAYSRVGNPAFTNQTTLPQPGSCSNVNCHFEKTTLLWGSPRLSSPADCGACHSSPPTAGGGAASGSHGPHVALFPGLTNCRKCHPDHSVEAAPFSHALAAGSRGISVASSDPALGTFGKYSGSAGSYLPSQTSSYGSCSGFYCHSNGSSVATGSIAGYTPVRWGGAGMACTGCHSYPPAYPTGTPKANSHQGHQAYGCNSCHVNTTSDGITITGPANHLNKVYDVAAGAGASFSYSFASSGGSCGNISCHQGASATWGTGMSHTVALGSGDIEMVLNNSDHGVPWTMTENCSLCHYADLPTQHKGNCALCHAGATPPANNLGGTWNQTCQQGACHPTMHAAMTANHNGEYDGSSQSCDRCHDTQSGFPGPGDNCIRCHNPGFTAASVGDHQPPVTTSDGVAGYTAVYPAAITITLSATDLGGAGVSYTRYSLDGSSWEQATSPATSLSVTAPRSGSRAHTLQFYSADHAMNVETVKTLAFTVTAPGSDTTPPSTVPSFNPAAGAVFNANQPVTLSATDNVGGSGVQATYYKIDTGSYTAGTSFTVSGDGLHSFSYYSVDKASNPESAHISNTFRIDTVAPVTTSNAVAGASYTGAQSFTLTATDTGGAGVAGTWYQIDTGAFTPGATVAIPAPATGSAAHTISWYSRDNATNQELTKSASFTVLAVPDATPPTTVSSFNPVAGAIFNASQPVTLTATDNPGGSGVQATYYRIDTGSFTAGTSFTISGDGPHSFSYYSVDKATNTESAHSSNSFRIDTVAPVTVSSFNPAAGAIFNAGQPVTLTATDVGGSGVQATYYKIDAGSLTAGSSFSVSGDGLHSFSYYSVDKATNTESAHLSNSFRVDSVAPVTTSNAVAGASYTGVQSFTLTATDTGGSGVAGTWYQIDNGAFTLGNTVPVPAPASGSASHTISWYSRDLANNQETTKSVSFTVLPGAGTTKLSFRVAPLGGWWSGHWTVLDASGATIYDYYSDDSGGYQTQIWQDVQVPAVQAYTMVGEVCNEPDGPCTDETHAVSAQQAAPGATVLWQF